MSPRILTIGDVIDQISLEGSPGITVECLYVRLNRLLPDEHAALEEKVCIEIWNQIIKDKELTFYELEHDRFLPQFPGNDFQKFETASFTFWI